MFHILDKNGFSEKYVKTLFIDNLTMYRKGYVKIHAKRDSFLLKLKRP